MTHIDTFAATSIDITRQFVQMKSKKSVRMVDISHDLLTLVDVSAILATTGKQPVYFIFLTGGIVPTRIQILLEQDCPCFASI